ncbi:MAG: H-X9-DG-CTERM domain-containing protein [Planctomycetota bacterium]|jgi:prepilin-type processing-associated H-X9-DG protein
MKAKASLTKKDLIIVLACGVLVFANLGAVGNGGRRRAKEALCASNLKRWGTVWFTFANDNGGFFMDRTDARGWVEILAPYYGNPGMLLCPEARKTIDEGGVNPFMAWSFSPDPAELRGSYGMNLWIANSHRSGSLHTGGIIGYWKTPYVVGAGDAPILIDAQATNMQPYAFDHPPVYETDIWTPGPRDEMRRACVGRHNGGVSAVFLDGSVRKVGLKHLWTIHWHRAWEEELDQSGFPVWPNWMGNFKDPQ